MVFSCCSSYTYSTFSRQVHCIEYTVHVGTDIWGPVIIAAPKATTFWSRLSVTSAVSGQRYQVLKPGARDQLYRSRSLWSIYFNGMVDPRDEAEGLREIMAALKAYNPGMVMSYEIVCLFSTSLNVAWLCFCFSIVLLSLFFRKFFH